MAKNKTQVLIQQEREKREGELKSIEAAMDQRQRELSQLAETRLRTIGCLEQLDALEAPVNGPAKPTVGKEK